MVWSVANHQVAVPFVTHKRLAVFSCLLVFLSFPENSVQNVQKKQQQNKEEIFLEENPAVEFE